tara:strand:- start:259 stop:552 length:294 start_codon:yes stop_codon:yes gene_type:complete
MKKCLIICFFLVLISGCKTVTKKVDEASKKETEMLNKFLKKTENDIKIEFGQPDSIENLNNNKVLVYRGTKFKIKCERRFEVNPKNVVVAFSSKNCF